MASSGRRSSNARRAHRPSTAPAESGQLPQDRSLACALRHWGWTGADIARPSYERRVAPSRCSDPTATTVRRRGTVERPRCASHTSQGRSHPASPVETRTDKIRAPRCPQTSVSHPFDGRLMDMTSVSGSSEALADAAGILAQRSAANRGRAEAILVDISQEIGVDIEDLAALVVAAATRRRS